MSTQPEFYDFRRQILRSGLSPSIKHFTVPRGTNHRVGAPFPLSTLLACFTVLHCWPASLSRFWLFCWCLSVCLELLLPPRTKATSQGSHYSNRYASPDDNLASRMRSWFNKAIYTNTMQSPDLLFPGEFCSDGRSFSIQNANKMPIKWPPSWTTCLWFTM